MKTNFLFLTISMALAASGLAQGTTGAGVGATGSTTGSTAPTSGLKPMGIAVQDGNVYFIQRGRATAVNESMLPRWQILTPSGRLLPETASDRGFVLEKGTVYWVHGSVRERVDTGLIPGGQMMTLEGALVPLPVGVTSFPGVQVITAPGAGPLPATSEPR